MLREHNRFNRRRGKKVTLLSTAIPDRTWLYTLSSLEDKLRNTVLIRGGPSWLIIDPQTQVVGSITRRLRNKKLREVFVVVSHEHKNHYNGLMELLTLIAAQGVNTTVIAPNRLRCQLIAEREKVMREIFLKLGTSCMISGDSVYPSVEGLFPTRAPEMDAGAVLVRNMPGHCAEQLVLHWRSQGTDLLFASDNITSCFPSPVTEGGSLRAIQMFLDQLVVWAEGCFPICLSGHGMPLTLQHMTRLRDYYRFLAHQRELEMPNRLVQPGFEEIAQLFHALNLKSIEQGYPTGAGPDYKLME